ncbi:MAG: DedA family protein [Proteobacteria bacterium]|nr:MAG: DedA family protein [Pseudomonadota bacterium]
MEHAQLQEFILDYGYLAVFVGSLLEGETILIMAGFAAHRGYLSLPWVVAIGAAGGFLGDQIFFMAGRWRGRQILARFPSVALHAARIDDLIDRHSTWLILGVRFMYGLRLAGPVLIGMSKVSHWRFVVLNLIGALIWAGVISGAGYAFGQGVELMLEHVRRYEFPILVGMLSFGAAVWLWWRQREMKKLAVFKAEHGE